MERIVKRLLVVGLILLLPFAAQAADFQLAQDRSISFDLPSARWQVSSNPPEVAIQAMMDDVVYETEKKGQKVDYGTLREKSTEYVKTNNLFVFNPNSSAYLMISISEAKSAPSKKAVQASTDWAMEAIVEHSGVKDDGQYFSEVEEMDLPGASVAYRIVTNYPLRQQPHNFVGIIGYAKPCWVFLYYNDKADSLTDLREMMDLLSTVRLN